MCTRFSSIAVSSLLLFLSSEVASATVRADADGAAPARARSAKTSIEPLASSTREDGPAAISSVARHEAMPSVEGRATLEPPKTSIRLANPAHPFAIAALELRSESKALPRRVQLSPSGGEAQTFEIGRREREATLRFDPPLDADALTLGFDAAPGEAIEIRMVTSASAEALIDAIEAGGSGRLRARELLPLLGSSALPLMEARFPLLSARAQRDLIGVYGRLHRDRRAADRLLVLSTSNDGEMARLAAEALPPSLLGEAIRRGARPARHLAARLAPESALIPLLERMGDAAPNVKDDGEAGSDGRSEAGSPLHEADAARPMARAQEIRDLRSAISRAARALGDRAAPLLRDALHEQSLVARARILPALAPIRGLSELVEEEIHALIEGSRAQTPNGEQSHLASSLHEPADESALFEIRYRALESLARLGRPVRPELLTLVREATEAEEWMIRALAYEALSSHGRSSPSLAEDLLPILFRAFDDGYPRVRELAASVVGELIASASATSELGEGMRADALARLRTASSDPFPIVRESAIRAAFPLGEALGSTRDEAGSVRLAVYERLAADPGGERDLRRALDREARPSVLGSFLEGAIRRCDARFAELAERVVVTTDTRDDEGARAGKTALSYLLAFEGKERDAWLKELERRGARLARTDVPIRCAQ